MKKLQLWFFTLLISLSSFTYAKPAVLDRVIASANGKAITESELQARTQLLLVQLQQNDASLPPLASLKKQLLDRIILEKLQLQQAEPEELDVDETLVEQQVKNIAQQDNISVDELKSFLEEQGVPFSQFKNLIRNELVLRNVQQRQIAQRIMISDRDIDTFLKSPAGQDQSGTEYHLGHILIPIPEQATAEQIQTIKQQALTLTKQLQKGSDFSKIAMEKSAGQQALDGGDLGWYRVAALPTLFDSVVPTLNVNEIHGPIEEPGGFHIIKLLGKRRPQDPNSTTQNQSHVKQIVVTESNKTENQIKDQIKQLRKKISEGEDFSKLAKEFSEESNSAQKGGDIGWVAQGSSVLPEVIDQATKLKVGEISEPFKTKLGWHIIQVSEKRTQSIPSKAIRERAMETLFTRRFEESLSTWLKYLKADSEIQIYLDEKS